MAPEPGPQTAHDATHDDAERFERLQIQRERDRRREQWQPFEAQYDAPTAATERVEQLRERGLVEVVPERRRMVHTPTGTVFKSSDALVLFHDGWAAAQDDD